MKKLSDTRWWSLGTAFALVAGALTGCSYTQLAVSPSGYTDNGATYEEPYTAYDEPEAARGAFGALSPYGTWIQSVDFGWVWQPTVGWGWQPYYHGHWVWSAYGWMWVSYEPFGWATDHYGFWNYDVNYGWVWIPGYDWAANTVTWIYYDDYVCWAPIPPPGCHIVDPWFAHADVYWVVVRSDHFTANDVGRYKERTLRPSPGVSVDVARRAPERGVIEKRTGKTIREINVDVRKISTEGRALQRPKLPPDQERAVDRYQERNPRSGGDKTPVTKEKSPSSSEKKAKPESKKEEKSKQRDSNTPKKEKKKG